jgi:DNA polymerase III subunit gamma/tau
MAYVSLYRKYRSQTFEEVSGQDHVTRTLQNAIRTGRVAHAYLFCGPRGTGKTSTARLLAKALNCENGPTAEPCNECSACVQINEGRFLDMKEIDAASNRGIDEIRDLRDSVAYAPVHGRSKVYVIDEAHQITGDAFNAFLKTLEEPPAHVVFIMATTEAHKIPATIVSRCQKFDFRRASLEQLRERVKYVVEQEEATIEAAALDLIARDANGGWRDALSLVEQVLAFSGGKITARDVYLVLGTVEADTLHTLADSILEADGAAVFHTLDELIAQGKDPRQLLRDLTTHFRSLLLAAAGSAPAVEPEHVERLGAQAARYGQRRLIGAIEVLAQADREARWSEQPRLLLELAAVRMMHPRDSRPRPHPEGVPGTHAPADLHRQRTENVSSPEPAPRRSPPVPAVPSVPTVPVERDSRTIPGVLEETASLAEVSPFVDETPAARPAAVQRQPSSGTAFGSASMPPPPLTVGDARTGDRDDEDLSDLLPVSPSASREDAVPNRSQEPPAQTDEAVPPPASLGHDGEGQIELLQKKWRIVLEELKRDKKRTVEACLVDTRPRSLERGELVILFPSKTMADMFTQRGKSFSEPLTQAIQRVTGIVCRVRAESGTGGAPRPAPAAAPQSPARKPAAAPDGGGSGAPANGSATPDAEAPVERGSPQPAASRPAPPGSDLVLDIVEVFDGRVLDDHDLDPG